MPAGSFIKVSFSRSMIDIEVTSLTLKLLKKFIAVKNTRIVIIFYFNKLWN